MSIKVFILIQILLSTIWAAPVIPRILRESIFGPKYKNPFLENSESKSDESLFYSSNEDYKFGEDIEYLDINKLQKGLGEKDNYYDSNEDKDLEIQVETNDLQRTLTRGHSEEIDEGDDEDSTNELEAIVKKFRENFYEEDDGLEFDIYEDENEEEEEGTLFRAFAGAGKELLEETDKDSDFYSEGKGPLDYSQETSEESEVTQKLQNAFIALTEDNSDFYGESESIDVELTSSEETTPIPNIYDVFYKSDETFDIYDDGDEKEENEEESGYEEDDNF